MTASEAIARAIARGECPEVLVGPEYPHCEAPNASHGQMEELIAFVCSHCGEGVKVEPAKVQ